MRPSRAAATVFVGFLALSVGCTAPKATSVEPTHTEANHGGGDHAPEATGKPVLENLIKERLAENEDLEVIVSTVEVPPNTELPKHYHPGQEFVYILEGSVTVAIDGAEERTVKAGEAAVVPARVHHRAWTKDERVKIVVFRVHDPDKPVRYLVGPDGKELPAEK
jgi:quercetin dioxygenase-like cupin family protein